MSEDVKIEISRLYRILNEMLKEGLLEARWEKRQLGPKKRVHRLGRKGSEELDRMLLDAIKTVHSFYRKYARASQLSTSNFLMRLQARQVQFRSRNFQMCVTVPQQ